MRALTASLVFLTAGCTSTTPAASSKPVNVALATGMTDVSRVLDDWHDAAAKADESRYFAHFAEGAVFMGTDATERWTVPQFRAYAHPHFARGRAWSFHATRREVTVRGDVAWFDEDLATPNLGPARGSGVLVREANAWKIAHYNLTVTVPNERMKAVKSLLDEPTPRLDPGREAR